MRMCRRLVLAPLAFVLVLVMPVHAQQSHVVDPAALAAGVDQHVTSQDQQRAAIREAVARPEVQAMADRAGVDLERVGSVLETMTGINLERAANAAQNVNQALVGGATTVTITTTTLIIVLLLVLLILVAIN